MNSSEYKKQLIENCEDPRTSNTRRRIKKLCKIDNLSSHNQNQIDQLIEISEKVLYMYNTYVLFIKDTQILDNITELQKRLNNKLKEDAKKKYDLLEEADIINKCISYFDENLNYDFKYPYQFEKLKDLQKTEDYKVYMNFIEEELEKEIIDDIINEEDKKLRILQGKLELKKYYLEKFEIKNENDEHAFINRSKYNQYWGRVFATLFADNFKKKEIEIVNTFCKNSYIKRFEETKIELYNQYTVNDINECNEDIDEVNRNYLNKLRNFIYAPTNNISNIQYIKLLEKINDSIKKLDEFERLSIPADLNEFKKYCQTIKDNTNTILKNK